MVESSHKYSTSITELCMKFICDKEINIVACTLQ